MEQTNTPAPSPRPRAALGATQLITRLAQLPGWQLHGDGAAVAIERAFQFKNYLQALAFVNAVAFMADRHDHHPDLLLQYQTCSVRFRTHDVQGISLLDFEAAARVNALVQD